MAAAGARSNAPVAAGPGCRHRRVVSPLPAAQALAWEDWRVFGTGARLVVTDPACLTTAREAVDLELAAIDVAASRFRTDSEICAVNRAQGRPVAVSALFVDLLVVGLAAGESTGGVVDPTAGAVLSYRGNTRRLPAGAQVGPALPFTVRRQAHWRLVEVDAAAGTVRVPAGVHLDLGATAKAYASDRAASAAYEATGCGVLVSLGGDIRVMGPAPSPGWSIAVAEDSATALEPARLVVSVSAGGLATAGASHQWRRSGQAVHHFLDPVTTQPAAGPWRTISVAGISCLEAKLAATAAVLLSKRATGFLAERGLPARLVAKSGAVSVVGGWPQGTG